MRVAHGKVVGGRVVVEGQPLPEGSSVTLYVEDDVGGFHLDDDSVRELLAARAEVRGGNFVTGEAALRELET